MERIIDLQKCLPGLESSSPSIDLSVLDPVTGAANHLYLMMYLNQEISRSLRKGSSISLLLVDADIANKADSTKDRAQDAPLRDIAINLRLLVRDYDVVARYRPDGHEFAVVLPETAAAEAFETAERLHQSLAQRLEDQVITRIGIATYPDHGATADDLVSSACHALNRARFSEQGPVVGCHLLARAS